MSQYRFVKKEILILQKSEGLRGWVDVDRDVTSYYECKEI